MSNLFLQRYNVHKRTSIERLTARHTKRLTGATLDFIMRNESALQEALDSGMRFIPKEGELLKDVAPVIDAHINEVIGVGIADGIKEISPDNVLYGFENYSLTVPVELTLTLSEKKKKDSVFSSVKKSFGKEIDKAVAVIAARFVKQQVRNIEQVYKALAKDWLAGESTIKDVVKSIEKTLGKSSIQAERIFRTETTKWFNKSRVKYFESETDVDYYQIFAITDGRISNICETRHGFVVPAKKAKLKKYRPPFHPNCRTILRPLISRLKRHQAIIEAGLKIHESRFAPLPRGWAA